MQIVLCNCSFLRISITKLTKYILLLVPLSPFMTLMISFRESQN